MKLRKIILLTYFLIYGVCVAGLIIIYKPLTDNFPEMDTFMYTFIVSFFAVIYLAIIVPQTITLLFSNKPRKLSKKIVTKNYSIMNGIGVIGDDIPFTIIKAVLYERTFIVCTISLNNKLFNSVRFKLSDFVHLKDKKDNLALINESFVISNGQVRKDGS